YGQQNGAVEISLSGIAPFEIKWLKDNALISTLEDVANLAAGQYTCRVTGANGCETEQVFSVPFIGATLVATPANFNFGAIGGTDSISVSGNCSAWKLTNLDTTTWLSFNPDSSAAPASVSVICAANITASPRFAMLLLSGCGIDDTLLIVQQGATLSAQPTMHQVNAAVTNVSFLIFSDCASGWTISGEGAWIDSLTSYTGGIGQSLVTVHFSENTSLAPRSDTLTLSGCGWSIPLMIHQAGAAPVFYPNPLLLQANASPGSLSFTLNGNCDSWEIFDTVDWITEISPATGGMLPQIITVEFLANDDPAARSTGITVTGCDTAFTVTLTQAGLLLPVAISGETEICPNQSTVLCAPASDSYLWSTGSTGQCNTVFAAGVYSVTVTIGGISNQGSVEVILLPAPAQPVIIPDSSSLFTPGNAAFWQWSLNDSIFPNQNGQTIPITEGGIYTVVAFGANGCESVPSLPFVFVASKETLPVGQLLVSPNPASDAFFVSIPANAPPCRLLLSDVSRHLLRELSARAGERLGVERERLPAGMYFLQLTAADGRMLGIGKVVLTD
ncbi:MAG: BACON domain-containing carbohydrate-binding protein, partial [Bacteroidota bacterium]